MKKCFIVALVILVFSVCVFAQQTSKEKDKQRKALERELNRPYTAWIETDVPYIITDEERTAWKRLATAEEKDQFIEQFWYRRDPTPDTPENEYKEEHYRRIAYANEHFGSGIPGWKTDRGRIYIMHGPPDEIESHSAGESYQRPMEEGGGQTKTYPFEKWRYRHIDNVGDNIEIEFVDQTMSGEYHLTIDPSEKDAFLYVPGAGPTLAESLGMAKKSDRFNNPFHLGPSPFGSSRNEFDPLIVGSWLLKPPAVKFRDLDAIVSSDIHYNLLPFQIRADFIKITGDTVLAAITVQIENKDLTFQNKDGIQHAAVNVFGRVSTVTRRVAQTFEDVVVVDTPASLVPQTMERRNLYWQALPLRPGRYRLNLVVKDTQNGNIGTIEKAIVVPAFDDDSLASSSLILSDKMEKVSTKDIGKGQFVIGSTKVLPNVNETFRKTGNLGFYLQVYNVSADSKTHKPSATIEYTLHRAGAPADAKPVFQASERAEEIAGASPQQVTLEKLFPLDTLEPGRYTLQVKITDNITRKSIAPSASFSVQ